MITAASTTILALLVAGPIFQEAPGQGADECTAADDLGSLLGPFPFNANNCSDTSAPATDGLPQPACVDLHRDIWFRWTAPMSLDNHSVRFSASGGAPWIMLWEGASCASAVDVECGTGFPIDHVVTGGQPYLIQLGHPITGGSIGSGSLSMTDNGPNTCSTRQDDGFEENDSCLGAVPVTPGSYSDLLVTETDADYYAIALEAGRVLSADVENDGTQGYACVRLYDSNCDPIFGMSPNAYSTSEAETVTIGVTVCASSAVPCAVYDLTITDSPDPCFGQPDADGGTCDSAAPLAVGLTQNLWVSNTDDDYFAVTLPPDSDLTLRWLSNGSTQGPVRIHLYAGVSACESADECLGALACSSTELTWSNDTGTTQDYVVLASVANPGYQCTSYDLELEVSGRSLGTSYCTATVNSAGTAALVRAEGSSVAADENLTLITEGVVPNRPGLYFLGTTQVQVPFGDGFRCAGGQVRRIQPATFASSSGELRRVLQFGAPYAAPISPGADLNFQLWYRDAMAGMSGFNLSDGVNVLFQ